MEHNRDTSPHGKTGPPTSNSAETSTVPKPDSRALLQIDAAGSITHMSLTARLMLGYTDGDPSDTCFFAHIHGRNLLQVMHDVASMVCSGKRSAKWMLRMKTATPNWIWVRLNASTLGPASAPSGILIHVERIDT
jgi:hypothetical protein